MEIEKIVFNEIIFITELIITDLPDDSQLKNDFCLIKDELVESYNQQNHSTRKLRRIYLKYRTNEVKIYNKKTIERIRTIQSLIQYLNTHLLTYDQKNQTPMSSSFESCMFYLFDILECLIK